MEDVHDRGDPHEAHGGKDSGAADTSQTGDPDRGRASLHQISSGPTKVHTETRGSKPLRPHKPTPKLSLSRLAILIIIIGAVVYFSRTDGENISMVGIAARVNGQVITQDEFNSRWGQVPSQVRETLTADDFLAQIIEEYLLLQKAEEVGISVAEEDVDADIEASMLQFGLTLEQIKEQLVLQNVSYTLFREGVKKQIAVTKYLEEYAVANISVTDEQVKEYYDANQDQFRISEQVRASHILIGLQQHSDVEAKAIATALLRGPEVKANFSAAALEYSEDPGSAVLGGDLGYFGKGRMVPEFEKAAFSLAPGELSEVVKTQFGYHIILVTDKSPAGVSPLEDIAELLRNALQREQQQEVIRVFIQQLKAQSDIFIP